MMVREMAAPGVHNRVFELIQYYVPPPARVLDIACGAGALSARLHGAGYDVVAVDVDPTIFSVEGVPFVRVDANKRLPFKSRTFDVVVSVETLEHLENPFNLVREAARILRPSGYFICTSPNITNIYSRIQFLLLGLPYMFRQIYFEKSGHISPINWRIFALVGGEEHIAPFRKVRIERCIYTKDLANSWCG